MSFKNPNKLKKSKKIIKQVQIAVKPAIAKEVIAPKLAEKHQKTEKT